MTGVLAMKINQGASFVAVVTWKIDGAPVNLAGYTAELRLGSDPYHADGTDYLTLTQANGLTLGGSSGTVQIVIDKALTAGFAWEYGFYQLDAIDASGVSTRLLRGNVSVLPTVP